MERRIVRSLLLAALLLLLCIQVLAAQEPLSSLRLDAEPGFTTRIEDTAGNALARSGVLDPDGLANSACTAKIASYSIYYNGRLLMTVTPVGFSAPDAVVLSGGTPTCTGFYKTTFSIDDTREIFLTGLTESTLEQVQKELTASALENRYFTLTNVDFIDAEKEFTDVSEDGIASDANLCWAAATSNMLRFSGWGSAAGFKTEDELFGSFISAFTDAGGSYTYALDWFFNGNYQPQGWDDWSQLREPGESGAYLPNYAADSLYQTCEVCAQIDNLRLVFDALERDCAVGISIGNYISWLRSGGHAITLWGYMRDTSVSPFSKEAYPAIFISDSDSDKYDGALRREAPNRLRIMMMDGMFDGFGDDSWELDYPSWFPWRLESFTILEPFSEELIDTEGTHDKYASLDFSVQDLCVRSSIFNEMGLSIYTVPTGQNIRITGSVVNNSPYVFPGNLTVKTEASITRVQDGACVWKDSSTTNYFDQCSAYSHTDFSFSSSGLPAGSYELTVCVSPAGQKEAYTVNNTRSIPFTVTAAAPDTSGASVSVDIPEFDGDEGGIGTLTFHGVDSLYPAGTKLTWAVYEKYPSILSKAWVLAYQGYEMPSSVRYVGSGKKVQTCVVLRPVDPSLACVILNAGTQNLLYHELYTISSNDNTSSCSAIAYGQKALAAGEQFSFYISNFTTSKSAVTVTPAVYAVRNSDNLRVDLWRGDSVSMAYGKSTEKTPHRVTSWDAELLPGKYTIYGEAIYEYGSKNVRLSSLQVNADKPFVSVGRTFRGSDRCAVVLECAAAKGSAEFGIECRKAGQEQTERVSFFTNFDSVKSKQLCLSFETDAEADYSYRTFIISEGETTYGAWNNCPAPSAAPISADAPQNGSADASVWEFTAPSDGVYALTVQNAGNGALYDTTDVLPKAGRAGALIQRGFYLKTGESVLFCVQAEASYTVEVARAQEMALCSPVRFHAAFTGYERFFSFTAPAAGSYVFHAAGESGWLYKLGETAAWEMYRYFSASRPGSDVTLTLEKGQHVYFRIAYTAVGSYSFSVSRPAPELSVSDEGVRVSYDPEHTGLHLIALYDTDGRMVDVRHVSVQSLDTHVSVVLQGTKTGFICVFQLDAETNTPLTAAKQIELA